MSQKEEVALEVIKERRMMKEEREGERERAGGQQYCKLVIKYSIFNQTPSIP